MMRLGLGNFQKYTTSILQSVIHTLVFLMIFSEFLKFIGRSDGKKATHAKFWQEKRTLRINPNQLRGCE